MKKTILFILIATMFVGCPSETSHEASTCSDDGTYSLGGEVSGLVSSHYSSIILVENNHNKHNVITNNGDFLFSSCLKKGEEYNITTYQYAGNNQPYFCNIDNASGVVDDDIRDITVTCEVNTNYIDREETNPSTQPTFKELPITFHPQHTPVWCWAATIAMVVEYMYQQPIEDCEVLSRYDTSLGGYGMCCNGDYRCQRTGRTDEMVYILGNIFNLNGRYIPYPASFNELKKSIDNNHPIIALLRTSQSGHVVVISGYQSPNKVIVLDPLYGKSVVDYTVLRNNHTYGVWSESLLILGKKR